MLDINIWRATGRALKFTLATIAVVLITLAVGADGYARTAKPLPLVLRVLRADELQGFVPKDRATTVASVAAWNKVAPSGGINVEARLHQEGFVAAVREDLEWTKGSDRGALSAVVRLGSASAAQAEIAQQVRDFADEPNRGRARTYTPFAVPEVSRSPRLHAHSKRQRRPQHHFL